MESFKQIDGYEEIVPFSSRNQEDANHMTIYIDKFFKDDLLFALCERATLANKTGIGDTYIYSRVHNTEEKRKELFLKYKEIINKSQRDAGFNPAEHREWYDSRQAFVFIGNNTSKEKPFSFCRYVVWKSIDSQEEEDKNQSHDNQSEYKPNLGNQLKYNVINECDIIEYLNNYHQNLKTEWGNYDFHKYPYYSIVIIPICSIKINEKSDIEKIYPIGTFFLHFAYLTERSFDDFYY